jgi:hypothetical protein
MNESAKGSAVGSIKEVHAKDSRDESPAGNWPKGNYPMRERESGFAQQQQ